MPNNQDPKYTQAQRPRQAVTDTLRTAESLKSARIGHAQATAIAVAIEDAAQVLGGIVHADSVRLGGKFTSLEKKFDEFKTWMLTFATIALLVLGGPNIARTGKIIFSSDKPAAQEPANSAGNGAEVAASSAPAESRAALGIGEIAGSDSASPDPSADGGSQTKDSPKPGK